MFRGKHIIILFFLLLFSLVSFSQNDAIKIGVPGIVFGDLSLGIEQVIYDNHSVNYNFGYWNKNLSMIDFDNFFTEGQDVWMQKKSSGWHVAVEMRNYFKIGSKATIDHFYWGPYFRLWNFKLKFNDIISNEVVTNRQLFDISSRFMGVGIGGQLGYHFFVSEKLWIDIYLIGFGVERLNMKAEYYASGVTDFDYSAVEGDVRNTFNDSDDYIKNNVEIQSSSEMLLIKVPVTLPAIRAGINIAYTLE